MFLQKIFIIQVILKMWNTTQSIIYLLFGNRVCIRKNSTNIYSLLAKLQVFQIVEIFIKVILIWIFHFTDILFEAIYNS